MRLRTLARSTLLTGLAAALLAGPIAAAPPAYAAPTTDQPAPAAAGWLADQLVDGQFLVFDGGPGAC